MTQELSAGTSATQTQPFSEAPTAPFVLSLIAGLLILAGAGMMVTFSFGGPYYGMRGGYYGMRGGYYGMMGGYYGMMQGFGYGWFYGAAVLSLIAGIVILVGAVMIQARPRSASTWGLVVLVFSILSFFGMGGFFVGAILGIVGGALAMVWRPSVTPK